MIDPVHESDPNTNTTMKTTEQHHVSGNHWAVAAARTSNRIEIVFDAGEATEVFIAGDFNQWNPHSTPLHKESNGKWRTLLRLAPGPHEYRFVVDGQWRNDPRAKRSKANPFGGVNSVLQVV